MHIWWSIHVVLGDKPKVADKPGPAVQHFGELKPLCLAMVTMKGTETEHHQHAGYVICSSKLPLHGRSISRRACAHMSPN